VRRRTVDVIATIGLPILAAGMLGSGGGSVDPCLAPMPGCAVHEGVSPLLIVPIAVVWLLVILDLVRSERRPR
jgi:hypothetical protein